MGEFDIIAKYFAPLSRGERGAFNLTDDAAVLDVPIGNQMVITSDCLIAGVHFLMTDPPPTIARKALGVNLSDLAAMGARPRTYTLAAAWPSSLDESWIAGFAQGLDFAQRAWGVTLVGGDTVKTDGPLTLTITAFGEVYDGQAIMRSGARPDDIVFVSGTVGDAALGLLVNTGKLSAMSSADSRYLIDRYRCPQPRIDLGPRLCGLASSAIDLSDGLLADLQHAMDQSNVRADVRVSQLPLSDAAARTLQKHPEILQNIVCGGDDYEILFTVSPSRQNEISDLSKHLSLPLTSIGSVGNSVDHPTVTLVDENGQEVVLAGPPGYRHF